MDYWLQDPTRLAGQPKATIADYVEQNSILVPRRFASFAEAMASGLQIIARSELTQDYAGASNLLRSLTLDSLPEVRSEPELKKIILAEPGEGTSSYRQYCRFLKLNEDEFKAAVSFSYWERLGEYNRTIVADSAIRGRYHVMTLCAEKGKFVINYAIVEDGKVAKEFVNPLPEELRADLGRLIESYESVRTLPRFDPNHCPIMEFQTVGRKNYFLQYHRARDFEPSQFTLDRPAIEGETEALFVRGATPPSGINCKITVYYSAKLGSVPGNLEFEPGIEDGSYDLSVSDVFTELRVRGRKVQLFDTSDFEWDIIKFIVYHNNKSKLFKPGVSIIHQIEDVLSEGETLKDFRQIMFKGQNAYLNLHVISDGRTAFVSRIG